MLDQELSIARQPSRRYHPLAGAPPDCYGPMTGAYAREAPLADAASLRTPRVGKGRETDVDWPG
jgi:hypothetical protein